jgi:orotidine-5'-phosphate decarboxylase
MAMTTATLFEKIQQKKSFLCVGLDSDFDKLPEHLKKEEFPVFEFNKKIIEATAPYAVAFKPNLAFYECRGLKGWNELGLTADYIKKNHPDTFLIADAKRGDIGNTSAMYAKAFFEQMNFDAVTVAPYMGEDSIMPFLAYKNKFIILLALTSNSGASDFQYFTSKENQTLFTEVIRKSKQWGTIDNMMYVVGATKASMLVTIRELLPEHFLLVPGVGAQGGSLEDVARYGLNNKCGLLVNASRSIIFANNGLNFDAKAAKEAQTLQLQMESILRSSNLI